MAGYPASPTEYDALLQFLYLSPVGLLQASIVGEIELINPVSAQLLMPLSRDGNLINLFDALEGVAPDLRARVGAFTARNGVICEALHIQLRAGVSGKLSPQMLSLTLVKLDDHRLMAVLCDATEPVRRERLLRQNEAWLSAALEGVADYALVSLDAQGRVDDWSPGIERLTGFGAEALIGQPFSVFFSPPLLVARTLADRLREADESGWSVEEGWCAKSDGSRYWGHAMMAPVRERDDETAPAHDVVDDAVPHGYCLVLRCSADQAWPELREAASRDPLTGLANRGQFFVRAEIERTRWKRVSEPLALILLDVDRLAPLNALHGRSTGDAALRHLTGVLTRNFRESDVVARIGGDVFAVLMPATSIESATATAETCLAEMAGSTVEVGGRLMACSMSGGIARVGVGPAGLDDAMARAKVALARAKAAGRNCVRRSDVSTGESADHVV